MALNAALGSRDAPQVRPGAVVAPIEELLERPEVVGSFVHGEFGTILPR